MSSKIKTRSSRQFIFEKYRLDRQKNTIYFFYSFNNGLNFTETLNLGSQKISWSKINPKLLDRLLFNLHLVFGLGYYKAYAPHQIIIKSGILSKDEAAFWNKLYTKGLGEFFYKNKIDFRGLINFPYQARKTEPGRINLSERSLLPWGGGKDSAVSAEILKSLGHDFTLISLRDSEVQKKTAAASGLKNKRLIINRTIDPRLIELNKNGVYNGHIPISAIYAWVTVLAAVVYDYRQIIYSNEHSANFGNVNYLGQEINHQYSKSLEFENDFRSYLKNFLTPDISYFSLLRAYSELKITKLFSRYPHYFSSFSSCNRNFSITKPANERWCGHCPKCAFVFSQLAAFLDRPTLIKIFNRDLLADPSLLPLYQELWGERKFKPFDCVGTPTEVKAALLLASQKKSWAADYIVKKFLKNVKPKIKNPGALINEALKNQAAPNIPLNFQKILMSTQIIHGAYK